MKMGRLTHVFGAVAGLACTTCSSSETPIHQLCAKYTQCVEETIPSFVRICEDALPARLQLSLVDRCQNGIGQMSCQDWAEAHDQGHCFTANYREQSTVARVFKTTVVVILGALIVMRTQIALLYLGIAGTMTVVYGIPATIASGIFSGQPRLLYLDVEAYMPSFGILPLGFGHFVLGIAFMVIARKGARLIPFALAFVSFLSAASKFFGTPEILTVPQSGRFMSLPGGVWPGLLAIAAQLVVAAYTITKTVTTWSDHDNARRRFIGDDS
jgi:hypothetical protein